MNASASQPGVTSDRARMQRASALVLGAGLVVSVMLHLGAAVGAGAYWSRAGLAASSGGKPIDIDEAVALAPPPVEDELTLGRQEARHASINWLGVVEDPVEGEAPESEVEQAQFTRVQGNAPVTTAPQAQAVPEQVAPQPEPPTEQPTEQPAEQPVEQLAEQPVERPSQDPVEQLVESPPVQTPEVVVDPVPELEPAVAEAKEVDPEAPVGSQVVTVEPTNEADEALPVDEVPEHAAEEAPEQDQAAQPAEQPSEQQAVAEQTNAPERSERVQVAGKEGVLDERESAASIIKRSVKVEADDLHKPLVGKGLEIIPVEPRFPASVRFTQLPRNPVLLITFNAQGRVARVRFLTEGKRVYDTGSRQVDEPLFNAVYQWRAKGEQIDKLNEQGQGATLEIPMRILFRDD